MAQTARAGQVAMTGSPVQLTAIPSAGTVRLKNNGAAEMYIGDSAVSNTTGYVLDAGESIEIEYLNPRSLYVLGTAAERLAWMSISPQ